MFEKIKSNEGLIICIVLVAVVACAGVYFYLHYKTAKQEAPKVMEYSDTTDPGKLKNTLGVDDNTAGQLATKIEYIHDGITPPVATYYVTAPTLEKAADNTASDIKTAMDTGKNTKNLPAAVVEKTDRTVVTADTKNNKVDVYKINLRNNHKIKAGIANVESHTYEVVDYQAGRTEAMVMTHGTSVKGGAVLYTVCQW